MEGTAQRAETMMEATILPVVPPEVVPPEGENIYSHLAVATAEEIPPSIEWTSPAQSLAEHTACRPDLRFHCPLAIGELGSAKRAWLLSQDISFEDSANGIQVAWEKARCRFKSGQHRQRERDTHESSGNVRYKDALPSSVARRI